MEQLQLDVELFPCSRRHAFAIPTALRLDGNMPRYLVCRSLLSHMFTRQPGLFCTRETPTKSSQSSDNCSSSNSASRKSRPRRSVWDDNSCVLLLSLSGGCNPTLSDVEFMTFCCRPTLVNCRTPTTTVYTQAIALAASKPQSGH